MKMRELEQRTGVNRETIRVFLREGLVPQPTRPKPNVADYGEEHVAAIVAVRSLQNEQNLSLPQIKRALGGDSGGLAVESSAYLHLDRLLATLLGVDDGTVPLDKVAIRNPVAAEDAAILEQVGAVQIRRRRGVPHVSRVDAEIIALWAEMRAAGFTEALGFGPAVIGTHVKLAQEMARSEIAEFRRHIPPDQKTESTAKMLQQALNHVTRIFSLLRMKAVLEEVSDLKPVSRGERDGRRPGNGSGAVP